MFFKVGIGFLYVYIVFGNFPSVFEIVAECIDSFINSIFIMSLMML